MRWLLMAVVIVWLAAMAGLSWRKAESLKQENRALRSEIEDLKQQFVIVTAEQTQKQSAELERLRSEAQEVAKLRGEVNQLRAGAKETEKLRAEVNTLRTQAVGPSTETPAPAAATDQFPRQSWAFSGYTTPESALVSAIWAMREGKPQVFLDSLSPEEQQRMAQTWQNKTEEEIAAKHQGDVGNIQGMRILSRTPISATEVQMQVFLEGANRMETFKMNQQPDQQWKFGGFIRK